MSKTRPPNGGSDDVRATEQIRLHMPVGATNTQWTRALLVARQFATDHIDRPAGRRHAVPHRYRDGDVYVARWTSARVVVVEFHEAMVSEYDTDALP